MVQSYYMQLNQTDYDKLYVMKELEFSGNVVEAEPTVIPQDKVWSNLEGHPECEKALSTPLDELSELSSGKVSNYYVAYAAIDLMNYHYTKIDSSRTVSLYY